MRYAKYKETGIAWLPEVPEGWEVRRLKWILDEVKNLSVTGKELPLSLTATNGLIPFSEKANKTMESASYVGAKIVEEGQIVFNRFKARLFAIAPYQGLVSSDYAVYSTKMEVEKRYLLALFGIPAFRQAMNNQASGIGDGFSRLYSSELFKLVIPLPPLSTQRAIVSFLEEKCGKVDRLVAAKEKEVALLKELKQSVIAEAVTGKGKRKKEEGKSGERRLVPSGIPWLPNVPEGWECGKVRQYFRLRATKVSEKDYPPLSVARIGVVPQLSDVAISMAEGDTRKLVKEGDYVVNSRSDRKGSCGIAPRDGSVTTISIVLEPHDIERKYVHYLFRSMPWVEEFYRNGRGIVADLWTTNYNQMRNMMLPVPPLSEQREIVAHIEARAAKIDAAVAGLGKEIAALKEYKQRLIADVVTGQRKVEGAAREGNTLGFGAARNEGKTLGFGAVREGKTLSFGETRNEGKALSFGAAREGKTLSFGETRNEGKTLGFGAAREGKTLSFSEVREGKTLGFSEEGV